MAMTAIVPAWTGSDTTRSTWSTIEPAMLSAMIGMPWARSSSAATDDVAAHDRAGEHEHPGTRQVDDRSDRVGDRLLADERDRVDRDALAAQVVPVGLGHGAQRHLRDLRAAADDDHPLAEDPVHRPRPVDRLDAGQPVDSRDERVLVEALDLHLRLGDLRRGAAVRLRHAPDRRQQADATAGGRDRTGDGRHGGRVVEMVEPDGDRRRTGRGASGHPRHGTGGPPPPPVIADQPGPKASCLRFAQSPG